ncbi:MAG: Proline-rich protein, partial [Labilithrix sp.]|nr:Proline-rich protein [Labilithrix sp.]
PAPLKRTTPSRARPVASASASGRRQKVDAASATARVPARTTTSTGYHQPRAPKTGFVMLVLTLLVLVAGGIAVYMFKPAFFSGRKKPASADASAPLASGSAAAVPRCKVALVVTDVPANAEILLRVGPAPLDVERMPVGTRLEFVATAEGYVPRRAVIKAESTWEKAPDGRPRIDVPIQLDPTKLKPGTLDPWPVAEPGSQVGGSGAPGTVHVVSNVRGAEIWLLAGLGPEARIEQLRCEGDIDVLLAGPPQLRKRLHVPDKDILAAAADAQGNRVVTVSAK